MDHGYVLRDELDWRAAANNLCYCGVPAGEVSSARAQGCRTYGEVLAFGRVRQARAAAAARVEADAAARAAADGAAAALERDRERWRQQAAVRAESDRQRVESNRRWAERQRLIRERAAAAVSAHAAAERERERRWQRPCEAGAAAAEARREAAWLERERGCALAPALPTYGARRAAAGLVLSAPAPTTAAVATAEVAARVATGPVLPVPGPTAAAAALEAAVSAEAVPSRPLPRERVRGGRRHTRRRLHREFEAAVAEQDDQRQRQLRHRAQGLGVQLKIDRRTGRCDAGRRGRKRGRTAPAVTPRKKAKRDRKGVRRHGAKRRQREQSGHRQRALPR